MVTWSAPSLYASVAAGESTTTTATFTPALSARGITVAVAPEIAPYVNVSPESFASVARGGSYTSR